MSWLWCCLFLTLFSNRNLTSETWFRCEWMNRPTSTQDLHFASFCQVHPPTPNNTIYARFHFEPTFYLFHPIVLHIHFLNSVQAYWAALAWWCSAGWPPWRRSPPWGRPSAASSSHPAMSSPMLSASISSGASSSACCSSCTLTGAWWKRAAPTSNSFTASSGSSSPPSSCRWCSMYYEAARLVESKISTIIINY